MMRSLYSAVSGLSGNMLRMDVIGNNIANVNTIGFKSGRVNFEETLGQVQQSATAPTEMSGGTNAIQVGTGSLTSSVSQMYTQGSLMMTGINTDLAIEGEGLFVLSAGEMRIYTTTTPTRIRRPCLLQNRLYRLGVAAQTSGYYYPPQLGLE